MQITIQGKHLKINIINSLKDQRVLTQILNQQMEGHKFKGVRAQALLPLSPHSNNNNQHKVIQMDTGMRIFYVQY